MNSRGYKIETNENGSFISHSNYPTHTVKFFTEKRAKEVLDLILADELSFLLIHKDYQIVGAKISHSTDGKCVSFLPYNAKIETISDVLTQPQG